MGRRHRGSGTVQCLGRRPREFAIHRPTHRPARYERGLLRRRRASVATRVTVAYAARAVGSIPLMSGGLLVVEAVLVPGLVFGGVTLASAICAMLIYRLISWIFIAAIGWVVFFFMFRTEKDGDPDAALQDEDAEIADPQFMPDPEAQHEPEP
jgi:hypothetical protein